MAMASEVEAGELPFWRRLTLAEMSQDEWESLCDGCGRCCLNKLEDWDSGEISWTNVACRLLDDQTCRCRDYPNRQALVPDCLQLDAASVPTLGWLPPTCAYRLVDEGKDLYWWHPLVSGDPQTVHAAGISVRGRTISEVGIPEEAFEDHVVQWPGKVPKGSRSKSRLDSPEHAARLAKAVRKG
jgi:uncharacterized cysteine cluster protein YcgN (CxxCxxCC family)